jgi:hypothetical protein
MKSEKISHRESYMHKVLKFICIIFLQMSATLRDKSNKYN